MVGKAETCSHLKKTKKQKKNTVELQHTIVKDLIREALLQTPGTQTPGLTGQTSPQNIWLRKPTGLTSKGPTKGSHAVALSQDPVENKKSEKHPDSRERRLTWRGRGQLKCFTETNKLADVIIIFPTWREHVGELEHGTL